MAEFELPEKPEDRKERMVGLIIAVIAVVLAIVSALAHETHNDEILAHIDAADQYAFYQAKRDRHEQLQLSTDNLKIENARLSPAQMQEQAAALTASNQLLGSYQAEMSRLDKEGKEIQAKGDDKMKESQRLAAKAGVLDLAEIALQISIVLCSISILTEQNLFVRMGVFMAIVGAIVAVWGAFAAS